MKNTNLPIIRIKNLNKSFDSFQVLKDINLTVFEGEKIIICGPSGSGKSTLLRCINGLEKYESGTLHVNDHLLNDHVKVLLKIRQEVGIVFQQFNLFPHLNILDNLILAPMKVKKISRKKAVEEALRFLKIVQIEEQVEKFPIQLSGGQQQRVAIARSLCMHPKIMLFDEPTSALDPEMVKEVLDCMEMLTKEGMTMICVTHEIGFAREIADCIIFMDKGMIIEKNTPLNFFNNPENQRTKDFISQIL